MICLESGKNPAHRNLQTISHLGLFWMRLAIHETTLGKSYLPLGLLIFCWHFHNVAIPYEEKRSHTTPGLLHFSLENALGRLVLHYIQFMTGIDRLWGRFLFIVPIWTDLGPDFRQALHLPSKIEGWDIFNPGDLHLSLETSLEGSLSGSFSSAKEVLILSGNAHELFSLVLYGSLSRVLLFVLIKNGFVNSNVVSAICFNFLLRFVLWRIFPFIATILAGHKDLSIHLQTF